MWRPQLSIFFLVFLATLEIKLNVLHRLITHLGHPYTFIKTLNDRKLFQNPRLHLYLVGHYKAI